MVRHAGGRRRSLRLRGLAAPQQVIAYRRGRPVTVAQRPPGIRNLSGRRGRGEDLLPAQPLLPVVPAPVPVFPAQLPALPPPPPPAMPLPYEPELPPAPRNYAAPRNFGGTAPDWWVAEGAEQLAYLDERRRAITNLISDEGGAATVLIDNETRSTPRPVPFWNTPILIATLLGILEAIFRPAGAAPNPVLQRMDRFLVTIHYETPTGRPVSNMRGLENSITHILHQVIRDLDRDDLIARQRLQRDFGTLFTQISQSRGSDLTPLGTLREALTGLWASLNYVRYPTVTDRQSMQLMGSDLATRRPAADTHMPEEGLIRQIEVRRSLPAQEGGRRPLRHGSFFPFFLEAQLARERPFWRYQLYSEEDYRHRRFVLAGNCPRYHPTAQAEDYLILERGFREPCLLFALRMSGLVSEAELSGIQLSFPLARTRSSTLKDVANYLQRQIIVERSISGSWGVPRAGTLHGVEWRMKTLIYGEASQADPPLPSIRLGQIGDHFFVYDERCEPAVTSYALKHYFELREEDIRSSRGPYLLNIAGRREPQPIRRTDGSVSYSYFRSNPPRFTKALSSTHLIQTLCKTAGLLRPFTMGEQLIAMTPQAPLLRDIGIVTCPLDYQSSFCLRHRPQILGRDRGRFENYIRSVKRDEEEADREEGANPEGLERRTRPNRPEDQPSSTEDFDTERTRYFFADTETVSNPEEGPHRIFLAAIAASYPQAPIQSFRGPRAGELLIDAIEPGAIVGFHNLSYDILLLCEYCRPIAMLEKGTRIFEVTLLAPCSERWYQPSNLKWERFIFKANFIVGPARLDHPGESAHYEKIPLKIFRFFDTLAMIPMPLRNFSRAFDLGAIEKEIFPYGAIRLADRETSEIPLERALAHLPKARHPETAVREEEQRAFLALAESRDCLRTDAQDGRRWFCHMDYADHYCRRDVQLLSAGFSKFRTLMKGALSIDPCNFVSLPSMANAVMTNSGAYYGVFDIASRPAERIRQTCRGGRVMTAGNRIWDLLDGADIIPLDARSLYPSAMQRLVCLPVGPPIPIEGPAMKDRLRGLEEDDIAAQLRLLLEEFSYVFVVVDIKHIGREMLFPLLSRRVSFETQRQEFHNPDFRVNEENGDAVLYSNKIRGPMWMNNIEIEDAIQFQQMRGTILKGYGFRRVPDGKLNIPFPEESGNPDPAQGEQLQYEVPNMAHGGNPVLSNFIEHLYRERAKHRSSNPALSEIFKLIMNTIYGILILRISTISRDFIAAQKAERFVLNNVDRIVRILVYSGLEHTYRHWAIAELFITMDRLFTKPHIGSLILAMSKRIMNEVFDLIEVIMEKLKAEKAAQEELLAALKRADSEDSEEDAPSSDAPRDETSDAPARPPDETREEEMLPIAFYQDTDSIHISRRHVPELIELFRSKYGRELIGTEMGQFQLDVTIPNTDESTIRSRRAIYLGKKSYCHRYEGVDSEDPTRCREHLMFRMKGIPQESVLAKANESYGGSIIELYQALARGEKLTFDLLVGRASIATNRQTFTAHTVPNFHRAVKFGIVERAEEVEPTIAQQLRLALLEEEEHDEPAVDEEVQPLQFEGKSWSEIFPLLESIHRSST